MSTPMIKHPPFRRLTNPRQMHPSRIPRILRPINMHSGQINPIRTRNLPPQLLLRQPPIQRPQPHPPTRPLTQHSRRSRLRRQRRPRRKIPLPRRRRNMEPHFLKDAQRRPATDEDSRLKRQREVGRFLLVEEQHARAEDTALREHERGVVRAVLGDVLGQSGAGGAHGLDPVAFVPGVVGWAVEEIYACGGGALVEAV